MALQGNRHFAKTAVSRQPGTAKLDDWLTEDLRFAGGTREVRKGNRPCPSCRKVQFGPTAMANGPSTGQNGV